MQKVNLCDACSKEKGVQDPTGFALADLLLASARRRKLKRGARPSAARFAVLPRATSKRRAGSAAAPATRPLPKR